MQQIDYSKVPKVLHNLEFSTAEDPDWNAYDLKMTEACLRALAAANEAVTNKETMGAQKIRNFIRRYPQVSMFKNHLWRFYLALGFDDMALGAAEQAIVENPNYFYGPLMLANMLLTRPNRRPEISALLKHWNIVDYAGRDKFAYHELMNYYLVAAEYHHATKDQKEARHFLYFLSIAGFGKEPAFLQLKRKVG